MSDSSVPLPAVRAACREALIRELLLRTFAHDVRGAVMGVMGWVELAAMEGGRVPAGLNRSLDRLNKVVARYDDLGAARAPAPVNLAPLLEAVVAGPVEGEGHEARVDVLRLLSAVELAAPTRAHLSMQLRGGRSRLLLRLEGLPTEGVQLAMAPHYEPLMEHVNRRDRELGVCLLRVVARAGDGELRGEPPDAINLFLPLA